VNQRVDHGPEESWNTQHNKNHDLRQRISQPASNLLKNAEIQNTTQIVICDENATTCLEECWIQNTTKIVISDCGRHNLQPPKTTPWSSHVVVSVLFKNHIVDGTNSSRAAEILISLIIGSSEGGFRSRDERKRAEKMWNMNEEKKWLENEARLNDTGNDWSCSKELCSRDSSVTQVAQPVVCVNVKRLELTRR
jgi:hypothetical protein